MTPDENSIPKISYFRRGLVDNYPFARIRQFLFGHPLKTSHQQKERLGFWLGFPILAVDTISSLAYATEEILLALSILGTQSFHLSIPITSVIVLLLWTLVISYSQTVKAYPQGGGAYIVAKHNIGSFASIFGASALILDYILTVAVSVTAGVRALTSAYPQLLPISTELSLMGVLILGWLNLRGVKESARIISLPVYAFILMVISICFLGFFMPSPENNITVTHEDTDILWSFFTFFIILRAFAGGCTAMTGIEAVANAGRVLKEPTSRVSQYILLAIGLTVAVSFFGFTKLVNDFGIVPSPTESITSQLAHYVPHQNVYQCLRSNFVWISSYNHVHS
ncbi:MAG: APC family permease [Proteobacteria bacterium]|nr:APC family permease [Pseudomonadota bacterium]